MSEPNGDPNLQTDSSTEGKRPWYMAPDGLVARLGYPLMGLAHKEIYKIMIPHLELRPEDDLLEIACGNGHFLKKYATHVRSVAGMDISLVGIDQARKKHASRVAAGTAEFLRGDACEQPWPWKDASFTVATIMGSLPAFREPRIAFHEMFRVLRPGGRAIVAIEYNAEGGEDHTKHIEKWGAQILSETQVLDMVRGAGFSEIEIKYAKAAGMPKIMLVKAIKQVNDEVDA